MKYYNITHLREALEEAGLPSSRRSISYWMAKGKLSLKRSPVSNYFLLTDEEIDKIIEAFSPDGTGKYHAK